MVTKPKTIDFYGNYYSISIIVILLKKKKYLSSILLGGEDSLKNTAHFLKTKQNLFLI